MNRINFVILEALCCLDTYGLNNFVLVWLGRPRMPYIAYVISCHEKYYFECEIQSDEVTKRL